MYPSSSHRVSPGAVAFALAVVIVVACSSTSVATRSAAVEHPRSTVGVASNGPIDPVDPVG
jgi:hypothetical protein